MPSISRKRDQDTILVAEDEILTRTVLAQFLRAAGHRVIEASTADDALAVLQSGQPVDLVITDIEMPGGQDGYDLVRDLRADHPRTRIIVAAASPEDPSIRRKIDAFFEKPYDIEVLVAFATRLLADGNGNGNESHTETA